MRSTSHVRFFLGAAIVILSAGTFAAGQTPLGKLFTVNSSADSVDAAPGDGICADSENRCTLRAAVEESNAEPVGRDVIIFSVGQLAVIDLTLGELRITGNGCSIVGPGARRLYVQRFAGGGVRFRIFHIPDAGTSAVIRGFSIHDGYASDTDAGGGAIRIGPGATLHLADASLRNHTAAQAGAILNEGTLTVSRSLFQNNSSGGFGGAITTTSTSNTRISNTTITSNAARSGGAIWADGPLLCINCTVSHNSAVVGASSIGSFGSNVVELLNSIVGSDVSFPVESLHGTFLSHGNNIITDARNSIGFTNGVKNDQVSNNNIINPLLGPLADNGGQTDTRALMPASPAINAGNSCVFLGPCPNVPGPGIRLFYDQRVGFLRGGIINAVDIGAYEVQTGSSSSSSSGSIPAAPSPRTFFNNSQLILTNVETGERIVRSIGPGGPIRIPNLPPGVVFVQELANKRSLFRLPPVVIAFPD